MGRRGVADCNLSARNAADQGWRLGCASCPTAREPMVVKTHQHKHTVKHRYELLETLGKGTFGKVKKAVQREGGKTVAIKSIRKERLSDGQDKAHIQREIEITSSLSHPNIICIYEVFESRDKIVMVMEYASGGELYDYLQDRGRLSETDAKHYFRQITSAVHYCHKNGVVHRDLKLENILLDKDSNIKLADFGLSNRYQRGCLLQTFCGSPLYASPEIINGLPYVGPEVDCWALGVLLYALVHGSMPFDGGNYSCLREQISHGKYRRPKLQTDACTLIGWLLTVKVEDRATVEDVANHWWVNWICPSPVRDCRSSHRPHDLSPLRGSLILPEHLTPDPQKCLNISQSVSGGQTAVTTFPKKSRTEITNLTRTNHAETSPSCALASPTHNQPVEPPKKGILKRLHQRVEEPTSPPRTCEVREAIGGCPGDTATSRDVGGERTRMDEGRKRKGILKRNSHFSGQERWLMACPESGTTSSVMASVA